ncbi:elongation factor P--(R)-beta-lysine ligase [Candidatus Ishikawella capsulata]|nr:elongation factor P--(R)-beta-lysine ligase [Candidatus Ishikawaella capsulata]
MWKPSASTRNLQKRANIISLIRNFFADRNVLEVETPYMSRYTITDINLVPFQTYFTTSDKLQKVNLWMITSPEYHMKRLLASGIGSIYQICHSFRNQELGSNHNPEFTILEWYRPGYDMYLMINEVSQLFKKILMCKSTESLSYEEAFLMYLNINPFEANKNQLLNIAKNFNATELIDADCSYDTLLQILFMLGIEPQIGQKKPVFIYHFPSGQAGLAKISKSNPLVSERFEAYYKGVELANGFCELTDATEQKKRFEQDNIYRKLHNMPQYLLDNYLLQALSHGMPDCTGVAIGIDRLIMVALQANTLSEVIAFPFDRC